MCWGWYQHVWMISQFSIHCEIHILPEWSCCAYMYIWAWFWASSVALVCMSHSPKAVFLNSLNQIWVFTTLFIDFFLFWPLSVDFYRERNVTLWEPVLWRAKFKASTVYYLCDLWQVILFSLCLGSLYLKDNISLYLRIG